MIALDNRGHGESETRHDPAVYDVPTMAGDVVALLDHLDVAEADLLGYSMGGRIGVELVQSSPERINAAALTGIGSRLVVDRGGSSEAIASALAADEVEAVDHDVGRNFRLFAEANDADLDALAAVIRAHGAGSRDHDLASVDLPVLIAAGGDDEIVGDPRELADTFGNAESVVVAGEDHLTTVPHEEFVGAVTDFLEREGL